MFFILTGVSNTIQCMAQDCQVRAPEDFVLSHVGNPSLRERYQQFMFQDHVKSHPQLRFCPGPNCQVIYTYKCGKNIRHTLKIVSDEEPKFHRYLIKILVSWILQTYGVYHIYQYNK